MKITDNADVALEEITTFYRNYHSLRFVDGDLVLRMHTLPTEPELAALNDEFADIITRGPRRPNRARPSSPTTTCPTSRLRFRFDRHGFAPAHADRPAQRRVVTAPSGCGSSGQSQAYAARVLDDLRHNRVARHGRRA